MEEFTPGFVNSFIGMGAEIIPLGLQQVFQLRIVVKGLFDLIKKNTAYDAASPLHQGDTAILQIPAMFPGCLPHQHVPLGIRDNFCRV
jgi:hypothetical protein